MLFVGQKQPFGPTKADLLKKFKKELIINMVTSRKMITFVVDFSGVVAENEWEGLMPRLRKGARCWP
jgi:hypothetical protein